MLGVIKLLKNKEKNKMTPLPNAVESVPVARVPENNMDDEQATFSSTSSMGADTEIDTSKNNGVTGNGEAGLNLYLESERLRTFENWPVPFIKERDLAAAGFYYKNENSDLVKCPYCEIEVGRWVPGDEPFSEHRKHSPRCRFVLQRIATCETPQDEIPLIGEDTCGPYGIESTMRTPAIEIERLARDEMLEKLKINPGDLPQYPQYCTHEERLKSFENWPGKIPPDALSMAGFVYSKSEDRTYCFHCGGSLHNWDDFDEPWVEHAHWFPKCKFVLKTRGQKFIDDARVKKHEDLARTQEEMKNAIETIKEIVSTTDVNRVSTKNCKETSSEGNNSSDESSISQDAAESSRNNDRGTRMCLICLVEERNTVLLPCYHVVACTKCVNKLTNCCVCREKVIYRRRIYIP